MPTIEGQASLGTIFFRPGPPARRLDGPSAPPVPRAAPPGGPAFGGEGCSCLRLPREEDGLGPRRLSYSQKRTSDIQSFRLLFPFMFRTIGYHHILRSKISGIFQVLSNSK